MQGRQFAIALAASLAVLVGMALPAMAKQGFYIGIGAAQQKVSGDLDGSHSYSDPSGSPIFVDGELDGGAIGLAFQAGYGFNENFALEYRYAQTAHKAKSDVVNAESDAKFTSQMYGAKLSTSMGKRAELFLRGGYGVYDVDYDDFSRSGPLLTTKGSVNFHGTGTVLGLGFEIFFQELGVEFGYTQHNFKLDRATPENGDELGLKSDLSGTATTMDVMFSWHF